MSDKVSNKKQNEVQREDPCKSVQMKLFYIVLERTFLIIGECLSIEIFRSVIQKIPSLKSKASKINKLYQCLKTSLIDTTKEEVNEMIQEEELDKRFVRLNKIIHENVKDEGTIAWRPPGDVKKHTSSQSVSIKLQHKRNLELYAMEMEESVKTSSELVQAKRDKIQKSIKRIEKLQAELKENVLSLDSIK